MPYNDQIARTDVAALIPEDVLSEVFQGIPTQSTVLQLARRIRDGSTNQQRLSVLSTMPTAYFVTGEASDAAFGGGLKQTTKMAWQNKYINYEEMAAIVVLPINVLDDSGFPIWEQVRPAIVEAFGKLIDGAVLFGTNAPAAWPGAVVPSAEAAGNRLVLGANGDLYDDILGEDGLFSLVESDGFMVSGNIAHPALRSSLRGLRDGATGQPIFMRAQPDGQNLQNATRYELDGTPIVFVRNGSFDTANTTIVSGAWDQLVYSWRRDATFDIVREGVIQDAAGAIVYNLLQQNMVGLRVSARFGWQLPNPPNDLAATEGGLVGVGGAAVVGRYPFAFIDPVAI